MCNHPIPHKVKDYGFAVEILCPQCWKSLKVTSKVSYVRGQWIKRFLNIFRSWIASKEKELLTSVVKMPDGRYIVLPNTYLVRSLAKELHMDEETLWRYALLFQDKNIDSILKPTIIPYNGEHLAIQIIPAPRECEPWFHPVFDLTIDRLEYSRVIGSARNFTVKVWLDHYFDEPTNVFIGVGDENGEWLGQHQLTLTGEPGNYPCIITARPPPEVGDHRLHVSCFYSEGGKWVQADSITFNVKVEDIKTSGAGAFTGGLATMGVVGLISYAVFKDPWKALLLALISAPFGAVAGDSLEYEALRSQKERQLCR